MLKVGLTGGIASGKTHVLRRFAAAGFHTLDLDRVAREVMAPDGAAYAEIVAAFGPRILDSERAIDRRALGDLVFADPAARRALESLVHPRIRDAEARHHSTAGADVVVTDAALLVETGSHLRFDRLVVVFCEPAEQLRRLMARDGISEASARARVDAQMPAEEKRRFAHLVIDSSDSIDDTDAGVDAVILSIRALVSRTPSPIGIAADRAVAALELGPQEGPRGLTPWRVVDEILAAGALDLARLADALQPPHEGRWYLAALNGAADLPPEALAIPVALWSAGRRPGDVAHAVAAAASLARLTHRDPKAIAGAIVAALAVQSALGGAEGAALRDGIGAWEAAASQWTGSGPRASVVNTVRAAAAHPGDREAAALTAGHEGGLPALARTLAGGPVAGGATPANIQRVARLLRPAAV